MYPRRLFNSAVRRAWLAMVVGAAFLTVPTSLSAGGHWRSKAVTEGLTVKAARANSSAASQMSTATTYFDVVVSVDEASHLAPANMTPDIGSHIANVMRYFADGVYEQTNGAHAIRSVTFYANGSYAGKSDMLWVRDVRPNADLNGWKVDGKHIRIGDLFGKRDLLAEENAQIAGYILAHEWGHYTYGVRDEYQEDDGDGGLSPGPNDYPFDAADGPLATIMNNQHQAASPTLDEDKDGTKRFRWLNHSTEKDYEKVISWFEDLPWWKRHLPALWGGATAHYRSYRASCWDVLTRPQSEDPFLSRFLTSMPPRPYWRDLDTVKPGPGEAARIDLPSSAISEPYSMAPVPAWRILSASADPHGIWQSGGQAYQIVLDQSGSMDYGLKMELAKAAAELLVQNMPLGKTAVGVVAFDDYVTVAHPIQPLSTEEDRASVIGSIRSIYPDGSTAVGDAASVALSDLLQFGDESDEKVVFLLTDGQSNSGRDPLTVIPGYQDANIPLFTFAYGDDADEYLLRQMAEETGGKMYVSPATLQDIVTVFKDANVMASQSVSLQAASPDLAYGQPSQIPFVVDSTLGEVEVLVTFSGSPASLSATVTDASGQAVGPPSVQQVAGQTVLRFAANEATPGTWMLGLQANAGVSNVSYQISALPDDKVTYSLSLDNLGGSSITYPEPIVVAAVLGQRLPIAGASLAGTAIAPDQSEMPLEFRDDGIAPDAEANDGTYTSQMLYDQNGTYTFHVNANGLPGEARFTYNGLALSYADAPRPSDEPVTEAFSRHAVLQVTTAGVVDDDHGNTPQTATVIVADNSATAGMVEYDGDVDMFAFTVPSQEGGVMVRASNYAFGMEPVVQLLAADGNTVLAERQFGSAESYVSIPVNATAGSHVFASVRHKSATGRGTYELSAGAAIASDTMPFSVEWNKTLRLPKELPVGLCALDIVDMRGKSVAKISTPAVSYGAYLELTNSGDSAWDEDDISIAYRWKNADGDVVLSGSQPLGLAAEPGQNLNPFVVFGAPSAAGNYTLELVAQADGADLEQENAPSGTTAVKPKAKAQFSSTVASPKPYIPGNGRVARFFGLMKKSATYAVLGEWNGVCTGGKQPKNGAYKAKGSFRGANVNIGLSVFGDAK